VRITRRFSSNRNTFVFGTYKFSGTAPANVNEWTNLCCIEDVASATNINAAGNAFRRSQPLTFLGAAATCTPSALTLQILNPEPLQTTTGIVYAGVMHTQAEIEGRAQTWADYFNSFVNYMSPRLMSAAKLALRGVQINSYPLDMNEVSNFTTLEELPDGAFDYVTGTYRPAGWAPIMVYNPDGVDLEFLVTTEWRVRFDLLNPASAGHVHHPVATDRTWDTLMQRATSMGNGVHDIVETVANIGNMVERAGAVAARLSL
jgi:hypothetical protein